MLYGLSARGKRVKSASYSAQLYERRDQQPDNADLPATSTLKNFFFTQSPFTTSVIPRPVLEEVIFQICEDLKARAISTPYLLLSYREQTDNKQVQALVDKIFVRNQKPLTGDALLRLIRNQDPYILAGALKWCWCRVPGGIVTWKAYNKYKEEEEKLGSEIPLDAFLRIFPKCVDSDGHMRLVVYFFELVMALATHGRVNGMGETKLPRLAGTWAFDICRPNAQQPVSFADGLAAWSQAAEASNHLFFAYLRWLTASAQFNIPKPLESLLSSVESYPPPSASVYYGGRLHPLVNVPMVTLTVNKLSSTPMVLLRRIAKTIQFDDPSCFYSEDEFNTLYMVFNDANTVEQKITSRSYDVIRRLTDENRITTDHGLLIKETKRLPYDLRAKTWSKYYNHACVDPVTGQLNSPINNYIYDEDQLDEALKAPIPTQERNSQPPYPHTPVEKELPSLPINRASYVRPTSAEINWDLFAQYGFDRPEQVTSKTWATRRNAKQMESSVTAAVSKVAIDDFFVWVWMSTLSEDQTEVRKATFGRSLVIETMLDDETRRWIVVEEILNPPPKPFSKSSDAEKSKDKISHSKEKNLHGRRTVSSPAGPVTGKRPKSKKYKENTVRRKPVSTADIRSDPLAGALNERLTKKTPLGLGIINHENLRDRDFQSQRPPPPPPKDDVFLKRNISMMTDVDQYGTPVLDISTPTSTVETPQHVSRKAHEITEQSTYSTPEAGLGSSEFRDRGAHARNSNDSVKKLPQLPDFAPSLDESGNIVNEKPLPPIKSDALRGNGVKTSEKLVQPFSDKTIVSQPAEEIKLDSARKLAAESHSAHSNTPVLVSDDEDGKTEYFSPATVTEDDLRTPVDMRSVSNSSNTSVSNQSDDTTADILNGYYSRLVSEDEGHTRISSGHNLGPSEMESRDTLKGISTIVSEETITDGELPALKEKDKIKSTTVPASIPLQSPVMRETDKAEMPKNEPKSQRVLINPPENPTDIAQDLAPENAAQSEHVRPARYGKAPVFQEIPQVVPAGFRPVKHLVPSRGLVPGSAFRSNPFSGRPGSYPHGGSVQSGSRRQFVVPRGRPLSGESFTSNSSYIRSEPSPIALPPYAPPIRGMGRNSNDSSDNGQPLTQAMTSVAMQSNAYGSDWSNRSSPDRLPPRLQHHRPSQLSSSMKPPGHFQGFDSLVPVAGRRPLSPAGLCENRLARPASPAAFRPSSPAGFRPDSPVGFRPGSSAGLRPESPSGYRPGPSAPIRPNSPAGFSREARSGFRPASPAGVRDDSSGRYRSASPVLGPMPPSITRRPRGMSIADLRSASPTPFQDPPADFRSGSSLGRSASPGLRGSSSMGTLNDFIPTADPKFASPSRRAFGQPAGKMRSSSASLVRPPDFARAGRPGSPSPRSASPLPGQYRLLHNSHGHTVSSGPQGWHDSLTQRPNMPGPKSVSPRRIAVGVSSPMASPPPSSPPNLPVPEPNEFSRSETSLKSRPTAKPLPLDPKWVEVKNSLKGLKFESSGKSKILPPVVDAPVEQYLDHAKKAVYDPSILTGDHVKIIEVKDTPGVGRLQPDIDSRDFVHSRDRTNLAESEYIAQHPEESTQRDRQGYEEDYRLPLNSVYHALDRGTYKSTSNPRHGDKVKTVDRSSFISLGSKSSRASAEISGASSKAKKKDHFVELVPTESGTAAVKPKQRGKSQPSEVSRFSLAGLMNAALKH